MLLEGWDTQLRTGEIMPAVSTTGNIKFDLGISLSDFWQGAGHSLVPLG